MDPKSMELIFNPLIRNRKILQPGKGDVPCYQNGVKVTFHFKTEAIYNLKNDNGTIINDNNDNKNGTTAINDNGIDDNNIEIKLIDDSKSYNKPMELFIGKQFKFPLWEEWIKQMRLDEISQISIDWLLCKDIYPLLSKSYRNFAKPSNDHDHNYEPHEKRTHCCGMARQSGTGHKDLDDLIKNPPKKLRFTIELIRVDQPCDVDKEIWLMTEQEMKENIPQLQCEGNQLFADKRFEDASYKYRKALQILEQLMQRERPGDQDWLNYDLQKIPLLCNLSQCELYLQQFYPAIKHTDEVLEKDPKNVKALYRRAKAHAAVWNVDQARKDFVRVAELDSSLASMVKQHLIELEQQIKRKENEDRQLLKGKLFQN